jgi:hypothetical protein
VCVLVVPVVSLLLLEAVPRRGLVAAEVPRGPFRPLAPSYSTDDPLVQILVLAHRPPVRTFLITSRDAAGVAVPLPYAYVANLSCHPVYKPGG